MKIFTKLQKFLIVAKFLVSHPRKFFAAIGPIRPIRLIQKTARWSFATLPRRIVSSILIALLIIGPISFLLFKNEAKAAWWDDNWAYRQKIQLTNSTGADLTDFQVSTAVDTATLITAGKMITGTCADMRFTDSKGQQLDYWIEENNPGCNSATTKVWIKAPKVYNGTNATSIYMYYGNPSATATQSGDKTFEFFDDFNDGTIDSRKWTMAANGNGGSYTETSGQMQLTASNNLDGSATAQTIKTFTNNVVMEWRRYNTQQNYNDLSFGYGNVVSYYGGSDWYHTRPSNGYIHFVQDNTNSNYRRDTTNLSGTIDGPDSGQWVKHKSIYSSAGLWNWYYDTGSGYTLLGSGYTDATYLANDKYILLSRGGYSGAAYGGTSQFDYIFTRKYASADPTTSASAEEVGPGPIAYWKFDEGQGTTTQDSTTNNNDGNLGDSPANPTWKPESECVSGKCLSFDGSDDYVGVVSSASNSPSNFTLSYWVKDLGQSGSYKRISSKGADRFETTLFADGSLYIYSPTGAWTDTGYDITKNVMTNLSFVYNGSTLNIYANGKNIYSASRTISLSGNWKFGCRENAPGGECSKVLLDEVKIYPYARSADQIALDMNQGKSLQLGGQTSATGATGQAAEYCVPGDTTSCAGPVGEWKFDEKTGGTANDTSGNGKTGTLTQMESTDWKSASQCHAGSCVELDGSNEFVDIGAGPSTVKTVEFWAYPASTTEYFVDLNGSAYIWANAGTVTATGFIGPVVYVNGKLSSVVAANAWQYISVTTSTGLNASDLDFGRLEGTDNYQGRIDDVKFFDYARTPAQIAWDYNRGKPVGWWKMDEGEGTTAYDSSGNNQNLTLAGAPMWSSGRFNNSLDFERDSSQNAWTSDSPTLSITSDLTLSAWIKPESITGGTDFDIIDKWKDPGPSYMLCQSGSEIRMYIDSLADYKTTSGLGLQAGTWYHVAGVYNATAQTVTLYVNGIDKGGSVTGTIPSSIADSTGKLYIGDRTDPTNYYDGQIDDVRVYNYALTAEQIRQVFNNGSVVKFGE
ncbi:MAG: DUF2341 domain-containing protein [Patescibacteria group bacterium]|nr:DUF2341 domain-containing protein [Patescibacteria group bacterium]